jgi:drug/metabolite transporter (DMT)-like permease
MSTNQTKGIYLAIITAFISGIAIFVNKFAVDIISPPLIFTTVKNFGVGFLILGIILAFKKWKLVKNLKKRELVYLALIGIIGGSIPFYLFFTGLSQIPAINAAIIHKSLVLWVAILAIPFLKEKLTKLQLLAVTLLFAGNYIVGGFKGFEFSNGELLVLIATMFWAVENVLAKKILPTVDPDIVTAARMGFGSLILLGAAVITVPSGLANVLNLSLTQWLLMILTIATLLGYVMSWYRALKFAPAITVASILVASTLVTNVLSAIFITHVWTAQMGIQALVILLGVILLWIASRKADLLKTDFRITS